MVLEIPSKEPTNEELAFFEAMHRLTSNPVFKQFAEAVESERERYISNLARLLATGIKGDPVDQRELDYKRGFWNGAIYAVTQFPRQKAKGWEKFFAANKESETA